jgi:hypothetical protein
MTFMMKVDIGFDPIQVSFLSSDTITAHTHFGFYIF